MRNVIMLLPKPDLLQLANCHKYVARQENSYSDIYTMTTIVGACKDVIKILVVGHGDVGSFVGADANDVANAIIKSGMPLDGHGKIVFDTCYAGSKGDTGNIVSAMESVRQLLRGYDSKCNINLSGVIGPSVTIGELNDKRVVVDPSKVDKAGALQNQMMKKHKVNFFEHRDDWHEQASSSEIKAWSKIEYDKLFVFADEFRTSLAPYLMLSNARKVTL